MENASKALLMAAGVLFGIVLLTLFVYLFTSYNTTTMAIKDEIAEGQKMDFNNRFLAYDSSKGDSSGASYSTVYDINTVVNMARDNNEQYGLTEQTDTNSNSYISVFVNGVSVEKTGYRITKNDLLDNEDYLYIYKDDSIQEVNKDVAVLTKYRCTVEINQNTGLVYKIYFNKDN